MDQGMNDITLQTDHPKSSPNWFHFGIMMSMDPRLYRVSVSRVRNRGRDDDQAHLCLPLELVQRANLLVNLSTGKYVKNRWEQYDSRAGTNAPRTLTEMFWSVDETEIIPVQLKYV